MSGDPGADGAHAVTARHLLGPLGTWPATDDRFAQLWEEVLAVEGWLTKGQAKILYRAASLVHDGQWIVEIGSHHGRSTAFLGSGKAARVPMLAVDPFDSPRWGGGPGGLAIFQSNLERFHLADKVEAFRGESVEAASQWDGARAIGLLFVDGAHDCQSVLADIDGWERHVVPGGLALFHDAFSSVGVTVALTQRHLVNRHFRCLGSDGSLVVFQRRGAPGVAATVLSVPRFVAGYPYFLRNLVIKASLRRGHSLPLRLCRYRQGDDLF